MGIGIVIATIVAYIAWQQHKTNRDKLRFDLYDKRLKVFNSLMKFLGNISAEGDCTHLQLGLYGAEIAESRFLFDKDIPDYLEEIFTEAGNLHDLEHKIENSEALSQEIKESTGKERTEVFHWLTEQLKESPARFEKYLKFKQKLEGKDMNWKRGFKRITLVLAIIGSILGGFLGVVIISETELIVAMVVMVAIVAIGAILGYFGVWLVYYLVEWFIAGFCDDKSKEGKNTKNQEEKQ